MKQRWLLIALLLVSITGFADEKTRCGHFQGKVIKIEQSYIYGWPEYVGSSVWDAKKFKKGLQMGCDDPFRSLAVIVNWPEMTPNGGLDYQPSIHNIVIILNATIGNGDPSPAIKRVLSDAQIANENEIKNRVKIEPETGLWMLDVKDPEEKINFGKHYRMYWSYKQDIYNADRYIECEKLNNILLSNCRLAIYLNDYKAFLIIRFTANLLPQWPEMEKQAIAFIRSKTIN